MSQYTECPTKSFIATVAVGRYLRVKLDTTVGHVVVAGLGDLGIGVTERAATKALEPIAVRSYLQPFSFKCVGAEAIPLGALVYTAAAGKVADTAAQNSFLIGVALHATSADGEIVEVAPIPTRAAVP